MSTTLYPPALRQSAWEQYVTRAGTLMQISEELDVPFETIKSWHYRLSWASKRKEIERKLYETWESKYVLNLEMEGLKALSRQFLILKQLDEGLGVLLERELSPKELATVAKALKASAAVLEKYMPSLAS